MLRASVLACAALFCLSASLAVQAHSPYLLPNAFDLVDRKHVTVEASFTETFFVPDVAMKADDYHVIAPDGSKRSLTPVYTQDLAIARSTDAGAGHVSHLYRPALGAHVEGDLCRRRLRVRGARRIGARRARASTT